MDRLVALRLLAVVVLWSASSPAQPAASQAPGAPPSPPTQQPVVKPPVLSHPVAASYPKEALAARVEAIVKLEIDISARGDVEAVRFVEQQGGGSVDFATPAVEAARQFRFDPAEESGTPVPVTIAYRYRFVLPKLGRVAGLVRARPTGGPVASARVVATAFIADKWLKSETSTGVDGRFMFDALPPGDWTVQARAEALQQQTATVHVDPEQTRAVELDMDPPPAGEYDIVVEEQEDQADQGRVYSDPSSVVLNTPPVSGVAVVDTTGARGRFGGRGGFGRGGAVGGGFRGGGFAGGGGAGGGGGGEGRFGARPGGFATTATAVSGQDVVTVVTQLDGIDLRGQNPANTRIVLDGIDVPLAYHFDMIRPIVPAGLIDSTSFYPGSFPIDYGGATAGLVALTTNQDLAHRTSGYLDANWADTSAMIRTPLARDLTLSLSGQYSTLDSVLSDVVPHDSNIGLGGLPRYRDGEVKVLFQPSPSTKLQLIGVASQDQLVNWFVNPAAGDPPAGTTALTTEFYRMILTTESTLSKDVNTRIVVGGGADTNQQYAPAFDVTTSTLQVRPSLRWRTSSTFALDLGAQYVVNRLDGSLDRSAAPVPSGAATTIAIPQTVGSVVGAYAGATWDWSDDFKVLPGLRFEHYSQTGETIGDPRVVARWRWAKNLPGVAELTAKVAAGVYHQPPSLLQTSAQIGNPSLTSEDSTQYLAGIEYRPNDTLLVDVDGFYASLSNVIVDSTVTTRTPGGPPVPQVFSNNGTGETRGVEVFVQQQLWKHLEGWLYYTFSVSDLATSANASEVLSPYDQTHVLGTVVAYDLPASWRVRGRFQYASGFPTTAIIGSVFDSSTNSYVSIQGPTLGARTPDFSQLDLRLDKTWIVGTSRVSAYLDVRNVYNRANVVTPYTYNFDYSQKYARSGPPVLPMFGLRMDF